MFIVYKITGIILVILAFPAWYQLHGVAMMLAVALCLGGAVLLFDLAKKQNAQDQQVAKQDDEARIIKEAGIAKNLRAVQAVQDVRRKKLERLPAVITEAKSIAFHIPRQLEEARKFIVLAESEFKERMLDPFWDAIEEATKALAYYDQSLGRLNGNSKAYRQIQGAAKIHGIVIDPYPIGVSELPQGSELAQQLRTLGRSAQGSVEFTTIYHMRRTNAILISGFTTFGQALCEIGDWLDNSIREVTYAIDAVNQSVQSAAIVTADAITNASSQQELRLSELVRASHQIQEGVAIQSAQSANATEKIIDTLDNIQRGRVPADIEYKPGTVKKSDQ